MVRRTQKAVILRTCRIYGHERTPLVHWKAMANGVVCLSNRKQKLQEVVCRLFQKLLSRSRAEDRPVVGQPQAEKSPVRCVDIHSVCNKRIADLVKQLIEPTDL
jgi:hypothetical protein